VTLRIVADENVPGEAAEAARREGHDVAWVRTEAPGSTDEAVLAWDQAEDRILMTFDKDFGELAFRHGLPASSGIVLFRAGAQNPAEAVALVLAVLRSRSDLTGHFSVVEEDRVRMTPLPQGRRESP
jgi:predicted nuclease of predicted toxin-antitoxin system